MEPHNKKIGSDRPFSLLAPMAMGGIIGGDGYTFQERYIVCHIPKWIGDAKFAHFMNEGTGDVDVVYKDAERSYYDHIQIKDHQVTPSEFSDVIKGFVKIDQGTAGAYRNFILASPGLSQQISSLAEALSRYKNALPLYAAEDKERILKTSKDHLLEKIESLNLSQYADFILAKLGFDTGRFDFNDNNTCRQLFTAALVEHPEYRAYFNHLVKPAYSKLIEEVVAHRGKVLENQRIHELIRSVLTSPSKIVEDTVLYVHNWTVEKYDPSPTIELDWSSYFDRGTRRVPDAGVWQSELIPQLTRTRQTIANSTSNRHIVFRGKCTLSTGFAVGMAFPEVGNWTFELLQYPQIWRSDTQRIEDYELRYEEVDPTPLDLNTSSNEIAVIFNITGQALAEVAGYFKNNGIPVKKLIIIHPANIAGALSIPSDAEAISLATASKDIIKQMKSKYEANTIHLFYYGPLGLSIFLGQKLTSVGYIQLYEFQDPGYTPSCLVKT